MKISAISVRHLFKIFITLAIVGAGFYADIAFAGSSGSTTATGTDLGTVANQVRTNFSNIAELITASSYVAGLGFAISAILKFKAHKDNPTQIPVGTPIALVFIAAALLFTPSLFSTAGYTLFSSGGTIAGVEGMSDFKTAATSVSS